MARIRTIKPEFWTDDKLTECSLSARLLFIGTWNFADDEGNLDRSAKQIKARVFPVDDIDCEPLLRELIAQGLLTEYSVNGKVYLHIQGFKKHQVINRPSAPAYPLFDESHITHGILTEPSVSTHAGKERKGREGKKEAPAFAGGFCFKTELLNLGADPALVADWLAVRKTKKASNTQTALDAFVREVKKAGYTVDQALRICCAKSWKGFDADWVKDIKPVEAAPAIPFDRDAYEAKRKAQLAADREAYMARERAATVPARAVK